MNLQWLDHVFGILELVAQEQVNGELGLLDGLRHGDRGAFRVRRCLGPGGLFVFLPLQLPLLLPMLALVPHR